jgi:beta-N-acetylhexosaminidase
MMKYLSILLLTVSTAVYATNFKLSEADRSWVEQTLRSMTVEEKVGQLLMPGGDGRFKNLESEAFEQVRRNIVEFHVGGYSMGGGDPGGTALMINAMQQLAKYPLLITADLEGGAGYDMQGATRLPLAMSIGATDDEQFAYLAGNIAAAEGRALGIHVNFYPVADVNTNPRNPIINIRSFGEDVDRVSALTSAYVRGAQEGGQIATAKHFPGHGAAASDSHLELPVLDITSERLEAVELPPFRAAIDAGVGAVMSAHIYMSQLEQERGLPATLSRNMLTTLLREQLGFQGIIFTDAMGMRGVSARFTEGDATVRAVEAGADVVLFPPKVDVSYNALRDAVRSGRIPQERLNASVRRVLEAKAHVGIHEYRLVDLPRLNEVVGRRKNHELAQQISEAAVTLVRDEKSTVPLRVAGEARLLHINLVDNRTGWLGGPVGVTFESELIKRYPAAVTVQADDHSTAGEFQAIRKMADMADAMVVSAFIRTDLTPQQSTLVRHLTTLDKPLVFTLFGRPFLLMHIPELPSYVLGYDVHAGAELAMVKAITGEIPFRGRLPVSLPGFYPIGHRLER